MKKRFFFFFYFWGVHWQDRDKDYCWLRLSHFVAGYSSNQNKQPTGGGVREACKPKHEQTDPISSSSPRPCSWPCVWSPIGSRCQNRWGLGRRKRGVMGQNEEPCEECLWSLPAAEDPHLDEVWHTGGTGSLSFFGTFSPATGVSAVKGVNLDGFPNGCPLNKEVNNENILFQKVSLNFYDSKLEKKYILCFLLKMHTEICPLWGHKGQRYLSQVNNHIHSQVLALLFDPTLFEGDKNNTSSSRSEQRFSRRF